MNSTESESEAVADLQAQLTHLQRHVAEQDTEIYRLSKRVEALAQGLQAQKLKLEALASDGGSQEGYRMPADEKPPHY